MEANGPNGHAAKPTKDPVKPTYDSTTYPSRCLHFMSRIPAHHTDNENSSATPSSATGQNQQSLLKLRILIVGAGLGGLGSAIALGLKGFDVQVFEQASSLAEVGAGIQIPPNSARLLRRWGVAKHLEKRAVRPDGIYFRRWQNGQVIGFTDLSEEFIETYQAPYYVVHRADFHRALLERAEELGVQIHLNSTITHYDPNAPSITTSRGHVFRGDLVIAADGVKSSARDLVGAGLRGSPRPTGYAAYRAIVPVSKLAPFKELSWISEKSDLNVWIGHDRHVMSYTIAKGQSLNLVLSHMDNSDPANWSGMSQEKILEDMRREFGQWEPQLRTILDLVDYTLKWPLLGGSQLESWTTPNGRLAILGDAAHAMLPYMSQGAAMAIEDGAGLATVLGKIRSIQEMPFALKIFEAERKRRSGQMQEASAVNSMIWHFEDGPLQEARDKAMRAEVEGRPFLSSPNQWSDPLTQAWAYGYDAEEKMEEAWQAAIQKLITRSF